MADERAVCPPGSLRTIFYGLLGPQASAVTYVSVGGSIIRRPVRGPDGAYLVVLPTDPERRNFYYSPGVTPGSGLRSVEYSDGSVCRIVSPRRLGGARHCPLKGFVAPTLPRVSRADLAAEVRITVTFRARVGTLKINVGYTQQRRPGPMPFDTRGFGNANVGRATATLR